MCSSSEIGVDGLGFFLNLILKIVERFEGGFAMNGSKANSLKYSVLVINRPRHGG